MLVKFNIIKGGGSGHSVDLTIPVSENPPTNHVAITGSLESGLVLRFVDHRFRGRDIYKLSRAMGAPNYRVTVAASLLGVANWPLCHKVDLRAMQITADHKDGEIAVYKLAAVSRDMLKERVSVRRPSRGERGLVDRPNVQRSSTEGDIVDLAAAVRRVNEAVDKGEAELHIRQGRLRVLALQELS